MLADCCSLLACCAEAESLTRVQSFWAKWKGKTMGQNNGKTMLFNRVMV